MSAPDPGGSGWLFVAIALAVPAGLEIVKRVLDYVLPPNRHLRGVEKFSRANDADDDAEGDCRAEPSLDPLD